jgi:aspartate carbamoyltransferase regulatory subunit
MNSKEKLVVEAIQNGTVIDHLPATRTLLAVELLTDENDCFFIGVNLSSKSNPNKGIIKIQDKILSKRETEILASLAPMSTVNIIEDYKIISKGHPQIPEEAIGLFVCRNDNCITNNEPVTTRFKLNNKEHYCCYCERSFPIERLKINRPSL